ncbi:MAG: NAD(P)/FAD-dependent oxidoreductase [Lachnospiraceae bacterium]|nr:NAD(P)/FAD-dependent oxidoreductase [Lachnospiraceae bacterium]
MKIGVIGGGAAGMVCAIALSENGHKVTLIEHGTRVGRKLLSTGNGKCNLSNTDQRLCHYHGDQRLIEAVFKQVSYGDVIAFLTRLGIFTRNKNGYLYPYSEQASAVLDVLRFSLLRSGVEVVLEESVTEIRRGDGNENINSGVGQKSPNEMVDITSRFLVVTDKKKREFERVVIAAGSKAAPQTGSDGSGYQLARHLGHTIIKPLPALTFLNSNAPYCAELAGIRFTAEVSLCIGKRYPNQNQSPDRESKRKQRSTLKVCMGELLGKESGEVQFTKTGISGIPVFQLSYLASKWLSGRKEVSSFGKRGKENGFASRETEKLFACLDVMPELTEEELVSFLKERRERLLGEGMRAQEFMIGLLPKSMALLLLKLSAIDLNKGLSDISDKELSVLAKQIRQLAFPVTGTGSFDKAQVCSGGVAAEELSDTLESKLVPGLYFVGEIIDVNGDCGGYNLTWAFATGLLVGRKIK